MSKIDDPINKNNSSDTIASFVRAGTGVVPFAGTAVGELATQLIPNQRLDRIAKFVTMLNEKFDALQDEVLKKLKGNEDFVDLVERSLIQAARAKSDDRRRYVASIVEHGMSDDAVKAVDAIHLLGVLSELNDNEIIWLKYYHSDGWHDRAQIQELHGNVLEPIQLRFGSSKDEREQATLQSSYKSHLERLNLIKHKIKTQSKTGVPEFNKDGTPKTTSSHTTTLGDMLLESVGLIETKSR